MTEQEIEHALMGLEAMVQCAVPFYTRGVVRSALQSLNASERQRLAGGWVKAREAFGRADAVTFFGACEDAGLGLIARHLWRYLGGT